MKSYSLLFYYGDFYNFRILVFQVQESNPGHEAQHVQLILPSHTEGRERRERGLASEQMEGNGSGFSLGWHFVNPESW